MLPHTLWKLKVTFLFLLLMFLVPEHFRCLFLMSDGEMEAEGGGRAAGSSPDGLAVAH